MLPARCGEVSQSEIEAACANEELCGVLLSRLKPAVRV